HAPTSGSPSVRAAYWFCLGWRDASLLLRFVGRISRRRNPTYYRCAPKVQARKTPLPIRLSASLRRGVSRRDAAKGIDGPWTARQCRPLGATMERRDPAKPGRIEEQALLVIFAGAGHPAI